MITLDELDRRRFELDVAFAIVKAISSDHEYAIYQLQSMQNEVSDQRFAAESNAIGRQD